MKMMERYALLAVLLGGLVACGASDQEEPEGVIPGHMVESMEKAENVEDVLKQAEQQRRSEIEE